MMADVHPLPLGEDDDDFFSDLGLDESDARATNSTQTGVLVIDVESSGNVVRGTVVKSGDRNENSSYLEQSLHNHNGDGGVGRHTDHCHVSNSNDIDRTARNQLIAISIVTILFMIGEAVGAILSNSIAIGTDVLHLASDLLSFIISIIAIYLKRKPSTQRLTWGYHRSEVLGAILSVFIIWMVTAILVYVAAERIMHGTYKDINPTEMLIVAGLGVAFNVIMGLILNFGFCKCKISHGHSHAGLGHNHSHASPGHTVPLRSRSRIADDHEVLTEHMDVASEEETERLHTPVKKENNIVIRAAFVHVIGDLVQSVGVLIAALVVKFTGAAIADPICTFIFSVLVLLTTVTVLRDSFLTLMEGVPHTVNYEKILNELLSIDGVKSVHSLHIWSLTSNEVNASVHLAVDGILVKPFEVVKLANNILRQDGLISRTTVQVEPYEEIMTSCKDCSKNI